MPVHEIRKLFEVNIISVAAITISFIRLLIRKVGGRIITMDFMCGIFFLSGLSSYAASKHSLEAIIDSLHFKLNPFNKTVSIAESVRGETPIWKKGLEIISKCDNEVPHLYTGF